MSHRPNDSPAPPARPAELQLDRLMHEALVGAGTSVWSWDIEPDVLGGIDGAVALLGYSHGERPRSQAAWNELIHPADLASIDVAFQGHASGAADDYECEYRARTCAGGWRWLAERGRIVEWFPDSRPRRMVGTLTDVTRRRVAEGQAREADRRLRQIAQHVPGVLYQFRRQGDERGHFAYVSERCDAVLGFPAEALMRDAGRLFDRIHPADVAAVRDVTDASERWLTRWHSEFRLDVPNLGWRWLLGVSSPRRADDGATVWHGYLQDVTDLRELRRAREEAAAAAAANQAKSEFLSHMSHEFRTPLNAVLGFAQLMELDLAEPLSEAQRQRMGMIRQSGEHLLSMIGDLLDHARLEAARLPVHLEPVPLAPIMHSCIAMLAPQAQAAGVTVRLTGVPAGSTVQADGTRLRQVLLNLVGNAIKYNVRGGRVDLEAASHHDEWALRVEDTGMGISSELQGQLFEPFNRLAQARSGIEGAGMGLAISRSLVQLMRGRIEVRSAPGVGSTFTVWLPAAPASGARGPTQSTSLPT